MRNLYLLLEQYRNIQAELDSEVRRVKGNTERNNFLSIYDSKLLGLSIIVYKFTLAKNVGSMILKDYGIA